MAYSPATKVQFKVRYKISVEKIGENGKFEHFYVAAHDISEAVKSALSVFHNGATEHNFVNSRIVSVVEQDIFWESI